MCWSRHQEIASASCSVSSRALVGVDNSAYEQYRNPHHRTSEPTLTRSRISISPNNLWRIVLERADFHAIDRASLVCRASKRTALEHASLLLTWLGEHEIWVSDTVPCLVPQRSTPNNSFRSKPGFFSRTCPLSLLTSVGRQGRMPVRPTDGRWNCSSFSPEQERSEGKNYLQIRRNGDDCGCVLFYP